MAHQNVRITKTTKKRVKKTGNGYKTCNMCHGSGRVKT
jgi:hypothetical protein